jgi:Uma2 family endonuclease
MGDTPKRKATYEDVLAAPDSMIAEIIGGVLYTQARPASLHAVASSALGYDLTGPFQRGRGGPGGWVILFEPELHLHGDILVPDLAGWRRQRMPQVPEAAAFELAPDWVAEVLSRGTAARDRAEKMPIYAREKVGHVWLIDPLEKLLEAYRLENGLWIQLGAWHGDARVRAEPFDAIELEVSSLWAR